MDFLVITVTKVLNSGTSAPKITPSTRNRIDANPSLIKFHESSTGPMPPPDPINVLPYRTRLATNPFTEIAKAQSEAYYEEILNIPAASLNMTSEFSAGHWYVVHPVTYYQVRDLSNRVLKDLEEWLEVKCPNELFASKAKQIFAFKNARTETLDEVKKEITRRKKRGEVGEEEGYTGDWEMLSGEDVMDNNEESGAKEVEECGDCRPVSRHTKEAFEEAAEAGRRAANEAKIWDKSELEL